MKKGLILKTNRKKSNKNDKSGKIHKFKIQFSLFFRRVVA